MWVGVGVGVCLCACVCEYSKNFGTCFYPVPPLFRMGTVSFLPPPTAGQVLSADVLLSGAELVESVCALICQAKHGPVPQAAVTVRFVGSVAADTLAVVASAATSSASATQQGKPRPAPDQSTLRAPGSATANATQSFLSSSAVATPLLSADRVMVQFPDLSLLPASQRRISEAFDPMGFAVSLSWRGHGSVTVPTTSSATVASFSCSALFCSLMDEGEMSPEVCSMCAGKVDANVMLDGNGKYLQPVRGE